ncbi:hypothetical protein [Sorangium sp. So ce341]|uniref:hypothetical protein n=1 Tax=Sorangium sp. So ce341 TaxID=3133302 RepID=UPI003F612A05
MLRAFRGAQPAITVRAKERSRRESAVRFSVDRAMPRTLAFGGTVNKPVGANESFALEDNRRVIRASELRD